MAEEKTPTTEPFEIEDLTPEQTEDVAGGACESCNACGGACAAEPPNQSA